MKFVTAEEAVAVIESNDRVFVHSVAAAPQRLVKATAARAAELRGVEVVHLHTEGEAPYAAPHLSQSFHTNALFIGANVRGASLSEGGKPIIALPSTTGRGESRVVSFLKPGAGVVTTRAHVHYVVTEYGVANLYGKNLRQRARALIEIAHPEHRARLERETHERLKNFGE